MSSKYPSKAAMMRHEKMEGKKEMEMEYGKKASAKKKSTAKAAGKKKKK